MVSRRFLLHKIYKGKKREIERVANQQNNGDDDDDDGDGGGGGLQRYLRLSQCGLYSMCVDGGRFRILRNVSRMRFVLVVSVAVRFQMDSRSSGNCVDRTTPQISGPTRNCSPSIAMQTFSHARSILFFFNRMTHLPPRTLPGSSHMGFMPLWGKRGKRKTGSPMNRDAWWIRSLHLAKFYVLYQVNYCKLFSVVDISCQ